MNLWVVRAEFGTHTNHFVEGGYIAIDYSIDETLEDENYMNSLLDLAQPLVVMRYK